MHEICASVAYLYAEMEHIAQGEGNRMGYEDAGTFINTFGTKRPRPVM
jgi:hypothetical protein